MQCASHYLIHSTTMDLFAPTVLLLDLFLQKKQGNTFVLNALSSMLSKVLAKERQTTKINMTPIDNRQGGFQF